MKLLYCDKCGDVVCISWKVWRKCLCGSIGAQYNEDGITATIGGKGLAGALPRVFALANPFFQIDWFRLPEEAKEETRKKYGYSGQDCWWGGYEGDSQLLYIRAANGPRLSHRSVLKRVAKMQANQAEKPIENKGNQFTPAMLNEARKNFQEQIKKLENKK